MWLCGEVHHPTILGLGLGGFGGELRVRASIRVSKLGGELLYQRPKMWSGGTYIR